MSRAQKTLAGRAVDALSLAVVFAILWAGVRFAPGLHADAALVLAIGFLLLAAVLTAQLLEVFGLPHLSGFLLAGAVAGPHVLGLISADTVPRLKPVNTLALALIALAGGGELKLEHLRRSVRSLTIATVGHGVVGALLSGLVFFAIRPFFPFARGLSPAAVLGVALLVGIIASARSPAATLGVLSQTHADGPLSRFTVAVVMISDMVVVVLMALAVTLARPLIDAEGAISVRAFATLGHELLGSVSIGTTLGLALAAYLKLVGRQPVVVLLATGFGGTEILKYLHFDPLLVFLVAGFVVQNLTQQGERFLGAIEDMGEIVYVLFFAIAGAALDLPLLREHWPLACVFVVWRLVVTVGIARASSRLAKDPPTVAAYGWSGLIAQAGLSIGLAAIMTQEFPSLAPVGNLLLATVAVNQVLGPILFKVALDRAKESRSLAALEDPAPAPTRG